MLVADSGFGRTRRNKLISRYPIDLISKQILFIEKIIGSDHNFIPRGVDLKNIERVRRRNPQASALSHSKMDDSTVVTQDLALYVDNRTGTESFGFSFLKKIDIIIIRNETNFLAFRPLCHRKAPLACPFSDL